MAADLRLGLFHSELGIRVDQPVVEHFAKIAIDDFVATVDYFGAN